MNQTDHIFLRILKAALQNQPLRDLEEVTQTQWQEIFRMAETHKVLPMVYHTVYEVPGLGDTAAIRSRVRRMVTVQALKTDEFLRLNRKLKEAGCEPVVVKGLICRRLYPHPDMRLSSDEDVLIDASRFETCCRVLAEFGMETDTPESQQQTAYEVPFRKKDGVLFVEMHKSLFPPESDAYGDWNCFFEKAAEDTVLDGEVRTLSYTDHLFYLICHAFKHFVHSGFGIRQVCDIVMFANTYGPLVDWERIYDRCCRIRGEVFAAAVFQIGQRYLTFDPDRAAYPQHWREIFVDETDMLEDLLSGGVYGGATVSRQHSSNMTLEAVVADKQGKKAKKSLKNTLFPSAEKLAPRYPYLNDKPWLLPAAWVSRVFHYAKESKGMGVSSAAESLQIGSRRVELLRKYRVIR